MDAATLREFKAGDKVSCGLLFPTVEENDEICWTVVEVEKLETPRNARSVTFRLDYLGVDFGSVVARELNGVIKWEAVKNEHK